MQKEQQELFEKIKVLGEQVRAGNLSSAIPFLFMLRVQGKLFSLEDHFQFEPVFKLKRPKRTVIKCARQVGKSFQMTASNTLITNLIPYYNTLFVCPLFSQVKRLSVEYVNKFLRDSPYRKMWQDKTCSNDMLLKTYLSGGTQTFSYAFRDADRIRGVAGVSEIIADEVQDIDFELIPVIGEVMSAQKIRGFFSFSGTPKTLDNTIHKLFADSSQASWCVPCSCGYWNTARADADLLKMIGKEGVVCAKCAKRIDPEKGKYVHMFPDRRNTFCGYHISQITHPLHYKIPAKWDDLLEKQSKWPEYRFYNEVLGEAYDSAAKPITITDLQKAGVEGADNTIDTAIRLSVGHNMRVMGVDWGGGGNDTSSYTSWSYGVLRVGEDTVKILAVGRLPKGLEPAEEMSQLLDIYKKLQRPFLAHDFGGQGNVRESWLIQSGIKNTELIPYTYCWAPNQRIIRYEQPTDGSRASYMLDKSRSLGVLLQMIKNGKVQLPRFDSTMDYHTGVHILEDFMSLTEERTERHRASDIAYIGKELKKPDDAVHAINYVATSLWYMSKAYPKLTTAYDTGTSSEKGAKDF